MKRIRLALIPVVAAAFILTSDAHGQPQTPVITAPGSAWSGQVSYDFAVNKPFLLGSFANGTLHSSIIAPAWSFSSITFGGTYLGSGGLGVGEGLQVSYAASGKLLGIPLTGLTLTAAGGPTMFSGQKPHTILFAGASVTSGFLAGLFK